MLPDDPDLETLIRHAIEQHVFTLRTHSAATVLRYDAGAQTVDVRVDITAITEDGAEPAVELFGLPVTWPQGSTGYLTFPLLPGARGLLHVQDRDISGYTATGLPGAPLTRVTHDFADATFEPADIVAALPSTSLLATVLEGDQIQLGRNAASPVLLGAAVQTSWTTYTSTIQAAGVTHAAVQPPNPVANAAFLQVIATATNVLASSIAGWGSAKVRVE